MKKFIVDTGKKKYNVEANDAEHAVKIVKKIADEASQLQINDSRWYVEVVRHDILNGRVRSGSFIIEAASENEANEKARAQAKRRWGDHRDFSFSVTAAHTRQLEDVADEASQLQTVNALIEDEKAAVEAYNVAIENLRGKIPEDSLQVLITTRDDENRHIENLQAVVNGTVTEKNLEDSANEYAIYETANMRKKVKVLYKGNKLSTIELNGEKKDVSTNCLTFVKDAEMTYNDIVRDAQIVDTNDRDVLIIALRETAKDLEAQRIDVNGAKKQIRAYL